MANRIQIRHGSTQPTASNLLPYELGWDGNNLYINNNGTIKNVSSNFLPLTGGTITGTINKYYNTVTDEPMFTLRSYNKDAIFFDIGHASSETATITNHYKLLYNGTGTAPNNYLQLIASYNGTDTVALQINENGSVTLNKGVTINNGGITVQSTNGTALASKNTTTSAEIQLTTNSSSNYQGVWSRGYWDGSAYVDTSKWLMYRDTTGNVFLKGNADTATKLAAAKTITLTGSVTGSGSFDGSANLSIVTTTNHNHDSSYTLKAGDTMTGNLVISKTSNVYVGVTEANIGETAYLHANLGKHGIYSNGYYDNSSFVSSAGWIIYRGSDGEAHTDLKFYGAVWNDYAEYRITKNDIEPGHCIIETGDDDLILSNARMQPGAEIVSDTFGFSIGQTEEAKTPIASSGRVLAYIYEGRDAARAAIGKPVCSGPNGTVSIMTDKEYQEYGYCAIGTISSVPDYEEWGEDKIKINGRIWIRIK